MKDERHRSTPGQAAGALPPQGASRRWRSDLDAALQGLEVVFLLGFLLYFIWVLGPQSGGRYGLPGLVFFVGFVAVSAWLHGDRPADLGIRFDTFGRAMAEAAAVIGPALLLAFVIGRYMEGGRSINTGRYFLAFLEVYPWALFQQFGLQCFFSRRLGGAIKEPFARDVLCAVIFAALHLPNPFLTVVTFAAGYCFCALFRRCPNLFAIGAAHALASSTLFFCLPPAVTHLMKVGPGYLLDLRIP
jgi:hypothetical protein